MAALGIWGPQRVEWFELDGERVTVGRDDHNDLVIDDDDWVSRDHAIFERFGARWFVRDLDSLNGVMVNNTPLTEQRALHDNDEVVFGRTKCVFRDRVEQNGLPPTKKKAHCPELTPREKETLVELCRAYFAPSGNALPAPATRREIAERMFVTEAAVQAHFGRLFDKFGLFDRSNNRRQQLANEAIQRQCVTQRDYTSADDDT
jgi:predicted component of type VI protein secretion system